MDGSQIKVMQQRIPGGVPSFKLITDCEYQQQSMTAGGSPSSSYSPSKSPYLEEVFPCECRFREDCNDPESQACGERSNCINRTLSIECDAEDCPCRDNCQNQRFRKHQYANVEVFETPGKGFGLRTLEDLSAGQFIIEYVGEVINQKQFERRSNEYNEQGRRHYYFMTLQNDQIIDATQKGNLSRFMNHSCNPNCATQKWIVGGRLRIGLFALKKIKAGTEMTFDYKFIRFGAKAQKCLCGEPNCKGVIGEEQKESIRSQSTRTTAQEEDDANFARDTFTGENGIENIDDLNLLARLLLRTEEIEFITPLLETLKKTTDQVLQRRFISLHGLQILNVILGIHWRNRSLIHLIIELLDILPVNNRNVVEDAHIEDKLVRLSQREDLDNELASKCNLIIERWKQLDSIFRIPKATYEPLRAAPDSENTQPGSGYSLANDTRFKKSKWTSSKPEYSGGSPTETEGQNDSLQAGWKSAVAPNGQIYYYHEITRESRWEPPLKRPASSTTRLSHSTKNDHHSNRDRFGDNQPSLSNSNQKLSKRTSSEPSKGGLTNESQSRNDDRLKEIIDRAKKAALEQNAGSKQPRSITKDTVAALDSLEELLKDHVSKLISKYLRVWCNDQISSSETFKHLCRKLTHGVVDKEVRALKKDDQVSSIEDTILGLRSNGLSKSKKTKIKSYLANYLRDHGYRVDCEGATSVSTSVSSSSLQSSSGRQTPHAS